MAPRKRTQPSPKAKSVARVGAKAVVSQRKPRGSQKEPRGRSKAVVASHVKAPKPSLVDTGKSGSSDDDLPLDILSDLEIPIETAQHRGASDAVLDSFSSPADVYPHNENDSPPPDDDLRDDEPTLHPPSAAGDASGFDDLESSYGELGHEPLRVVAGDLLDTMGDVNDTGAFLRHAIEALLFVSEKPITLKELAKGLQLDKKRTLELLGELRFEYENRGIRIDEVADGYAFRTHPSIAEYVRTFLEQRPVKLSRAQLETLSIVAYRQPITRPEVDDIRGVDCGPVLKGLLERDLVRILGKKDEPGRPMLYGTTPTFLELFGLKSLQELPTLREFAELSDESKLKYEEEIGEGPPVGLADLGLFSESDITESNVAGGADGLTGAGMATSTAANTPADTVEDESQLLKRKDDEESDSDDASKGDEDEDEDDKDEDEDDKDEDDEDDKDEDDKDDEDNKEK